MRQCLKKAFRVRHVLHRKLTTSGHPASAAPRLVRRSALEGWVTLILERPD